MFNFFGRKKVLIVTALLMTGGVKAECKIPKGDWQRIQCSDVKVQKEETTCVLTAKCNTRYDGGYAPAYTITTVRYYEDKTPQIKVENGTLIKIKPKNKTEEIIAEESR